MGNLIEYAKLTQPQLQALDKSRCIVCMVCSPLEVHGPHMPLGQDLMMATALAKGAAETFIKERPDWNALLMPPIPLGVDTLPQIGSVFHTAETVKRAVYEYGRSLAHYGFNTIFLFNFHGSPRHGLALEEASREVSEKTGAQMIFIFNYIMANYIKTGQAGRDILEAFPHIDELDLKDDYHAGLFETSLALNFYPELIDEGHKSLPPLYVSEYQPVKNGDQKLKELFKGGGDDPVFKTLETVNSILSMVNLMKNETYAGSPARASEEIGRFIAERLQAIGLEVMCKVVDGELTEKDMRTSLHKAGILNPGAPLSRIIGAVRGRGELAGRKAGKR